MLVISLNYVYLFQPPFSDTAFMHLCLCLFIIYHNNNTSTLSSYLSFYIYVCCIFDKEVWANWEKMKKKKKTSNNCFHLVRFIFRFLFLPFIDSFGYSVCADIDIYFDWSMVCNMLSTSVCIDKWTSLVFSWIDMDWSAPLRYAYITKKNSRYFFYLFKKRIHLLFLWHFFMLYVLCFLVYIFVFYSTAHTYLCT